MRWILSGTPLIALVQDFAVHPNQIRQWHHKVFVKRLWRIINWRWTYNHRPPNIGIGSMALAKR